MKKFLSLLLMVCLLVVPAYAEEIPDQPVENEVNQQEDYVVVSTLDELRSAITTANDADTILVSQTITIKRQNLVSEKNITLIRTEGFSNCIFELYDGSAISGFTIIDDVQKTCSVYAETHSETISISNCTFIGNNNDYSYMINIFNGDVEVLACTFLHGNEAAICTSSTSNVVVNDCFFEGNKSILRGGAIRNNGDLIIKNSEITKNQASLGGGISNRGNLTINNCIIKDNASIEEPGADIFSDGILTIESIVGLSNDTAFYNEVSGERIILPVEDYESPLKLICLTDEQAKEYFSPTPPQEDETPSTPRDDNGNEDNPPEPPQQSEDQPGGDSLPKDDYEGDPVDSPGTVPETPQQPQEPADNESNNDTPPIDYRPIQRPTRPTVTVQTDTQTQPESISIPAPSLACNGAVIDTSRTIVLLGYGDGLIHEDDPVTRAQLATIIYRLLDDETIARYSGMGSVFADVSTGAWYAPYVSVIGTAGIVNGVGGGRYDPNGLVTWAQIITILSRFVEPQSYELQHIQYDGWAAQAIQTAVALDWIADSAALNPDAIISRGELVQLVNGVLAIYR